MGWLAKKRARDRAHIWNGNEPENSRKKGKARGKAAAVMAA